MIPSAQRIIVCVLFCLCFCAHAQTDADFNPVILKNGVVYDYESEANEKIIFVGGFTHFNNLPAGGGVRLTTSGSVDNTFQISADDGSILDIFKGPSGYFLTGLFQSFNGVTNKFIAKVDANGVLDKSFLFSGTIGTSKFYQVNGGVSQADGKILAFGESYDEKKPFFRLNANGSVDGSFNVGTGFNEGVIGARIQSDGKIICIGGFSIYNGVAAIAIARLNTDGSRDLTFSNPIQKGYISNFNIMPDGKILVGGSMSFDGTSYHGIARLNVDGSLDNTFVPALSGITSITVRDDGKIVVSDVLQKLTLLSSTGAVEKSINLSAIYAEYPARLPNNKTVIFSESRLYALDENLVEDANFHVGTPQAAAQINGIIQTPSKDIYLAGDMLYYNNTFMRSLVRLKEDLSLDQNFHFNAGASVITKNVTALALQSDGKILVGGEFTKFLSNVSDLIRLNADGSYDNSFVSNVNGLISGLKPLSNGKILVLGSFNIAGTFFNILGLNADGSKDTTFLTFIDGPVQEIVVQPDQKMLFSGFFSKYNGTGVKSVFRTNQDGTIDNTFFSNAVSATHFQSMNLLPDGKILASGIIYKPDAAASSPVARFNADGTFDNTFTFNQKLGVGFKTYLLNDYILSFETNDALFRLQLYSKDGAHLGPLAEFANTYYRASIQLNDGSLLMSSDYTYTSKRNLTHFKTPLVTSIETKAEPVTLGVYPNPVKDILKVTSNGEPVVKIEAWDISGKRIIVQPDLSAIDFTGNHSGLYFVKVSTPHHSKCFKVVKD